MSANDGVYVIRRNDESYSVAMVSAIDNLDFYRAIGGAPYEEYVESIWGRGRNFPDYESAIEYANQIDVETEYGVQYLGNV